MLLSNESDGQRLDLNKLQTKMEDEGMYNLRIEQKPSIGKTHVVEIYYENSIPLSKAVAAQMVLGQNFEVKVLQEILDEYSNSVVGTNA
jgi:hypothetical protein